MHKFNELKKAIEEAEVDAVKFYKEENNAAGTRLRKAMQDIKAKASEIRAEVQEIKNKA